MKRTLPALTLAATIAALAACSTPQPAVRYVPITATFTVADCGAYPGGAVTGQGTNAVCRIVP